LPREGRADGSDQAIPVVRLFAKALAACDREVVELGAAIVFGGSPIRLKEALADKAKEARIKGTLFDQQLVAGNLFDAKEDAVAMLRAKGNGTEDEEIQSALKKLSLA